MSRIAYGVPLPALWRQFIAEVGLGLNGKVQAVTTARPWEKPIGRGGEIWQVDHGVGSSLGWDGGVRPADGRGQRLDVVHRRQRGPRRRPARRRARWRRAGRSWPRAACPGMAAATGATVRRTNWHDEPFTDGQLRQFPSRPADQVRRADLDRSERRRLGAAVGRTGLFRRRASVRRLSRLYERRRADRPACGAGGHRGPGAGAADGLRAVSAHARPRPSNAGRPFTITRSNPSAIANGST